MKEKEVAKQIADETTLNPKEAEMAVAQLKKVLIMHSQMAIAYNLAIGGRSIFLSVVKGRKKKTTSVPTM